LAREPSIFNIKPTDDIVKYLANFLGDHCKLENVEVRIEDEWKKKKEKKKKLILLFRLKQN
jgi:hypothetical protein